ncbi:alpha/beta fold hydrolase [Piscinibacter sakaiensis]|uniref:alpha/beta fold hydrolase n=1 Tax=Piscinibacter sakaiensis TaxID=1547922 RepID=UPI003AAA63EC
MALRLAFEVSGSGPPVVILHSLLGSGRNWRPIAAELAQSHRVYCVDLRNHGHSPWAASMEYAEMADDVRMLIETEKLEQPLLIGHGLGGKVAMALALKSPAAIGRLVIVDIAPVSYAERLLPYFEAVSGIDIRSADERRIALQRITEKMPGSAAVGFLNDLAAAPADLLDERLNLQAIATSVRTLCEFPPELLLLSCPLPTLLIRGARSDRVQPAAAAALTEQFPQLRVVTIDGAGHWVHADRPAQFIAALALE